MLRTVSFALVIFALLSTFGCGAVRDLGFSPEEETLDQEEAFQLLARDHDPEWVYEQGIGSTVEEAREQALSLLARRAAIHVRAETERVVQQTDGSKHVEEKMKSTTATLAHVALEGTEVTGSKRLKTGWMVEMGIARQDLATARREARERAPLLARFETLESLPEDNSIQRLELAFQGLQEARKKNLLDDPLYLPEQEIRTTFGMYFEQETFMALNRLKILPIRTKEGQGEVVLIDSRSYAPQRGAPLIIGNQEYGTDEQGSIGSLSSEKFEKQLEVYLDQDRLDADSIEVQELSHEDFHLDTLHPQDWESSQTMLYIHTQPSGHTMLINEEQQEISPAKIRIKRTSGEIKVMATEKFSEKHVSYSVAEESPAAYANIQLTERRFAEVIFDVQGQGKMELDGPQSFTLEDRYEGTLEAGQYDISILHQDHDAQQADYQILKDEVTLFEGQRLKRIYQEPLYREPYYRGSGWSFSFISLGSYQSRYPLSGGQEEKTAGDVPREEDIDIKSFHLDLAADYRSFTDSYGPWMYQIGGGWRISPYEEKTAPGDDWENFHTVYARAGVGFWTELSDYPVWIGPSYTLEHISPPADWSSFSHDYGYIEAGMLWGSFEIVARVPLNDEGFGPYVGMAFSFADIERGYERSPTQSAQEGINYEQKTGSKIESPLTDKR